MNRSSYFVRRLCGCALMLAAALLQLSCSRPSEPIPVRDVTLAQPLDLGDAELNQAAAQARSSLPEFLTASSNPKSEGTAFMAKIRVRETNPDAEEDIWVSSITAEANGTYTGVVGDVPAKLQTLNMSDIVRFAPSQVIEWQYFEREKIIGAQVTRILRSRMSEADRKAHDATFQPFHF